MIETELSLAQIRQSLFDPMENTRIEDEAWRIGSDAIPLESLTLTEQEEFTTTFDPAAVKVQRVSALPSKAEVVIGGLCSIFTGDLKQENEWEAVKQLRMDQIVESVGNVRGKTIFVVMEDSFFSRLKGMPMNELQKQAARATERIARWLELSTGEAPDLRVALTSNPNLERGIYDAVGYMANDILKNPNFSRMQSAPIIMMYTSLWADLLASLSYIPSRNVVCVEPVGHFVDNRSFPDFTLKSAYLDFLAWLKDNPYGKAESANTTMGIAGFLESVTGNQTKKRTRLLPLTEVPTTENVKTWVATMQEQATLFPFPLHNSPVLAEAVNWGLWNPLIREQVATLIALEYEYYQERNAMNATRASVAEKMERAKTMRETFSIAAKPATQVLAKEVGNILSIVLGE